MVKVVVPDASAIVTYSMVAKDDDKCYVMRNRGNRPCAINIGLFKTYKVWMKLDNWGREGSQNPNGCQQFSNECAQKITGGILEMLLEVVLTELVHNGGVDVCNPPSNHYFIQSQYQTPP
jgi:hypothetical protein